MVYIVGAVGILVFFILLLLCAFITFTFSKSSFEKQLNVIKDEQLKERQQHKDELKQLRLDERLRDEEHAKQLEAVRESYLKIGFDIGKENKQQVTPPEVSEEERQRVENLNKSFTQLMNYDVGVAIGRKKVE